MQPLSRDPIAGSPAWVPAAHWVCAAAFGLALAVFVAQYLDVVHLLPPGWPEAVLLVAATVSTLVSLARQLPAQNVALAAVLIAVLGAGVQAIGRETAIPFGPFEYGPAAGPRLFGTQPWWVPLLWVTVLLNARGVARLILRPWRRSQFFGFCQAGLAAMLAAAFDLGLQPLAARANQFWVWTSPHPVWYGAPLSRFLGLLLVAAVILVLVTPALINKSPVRLPVDRFPLTAWILLNAACVAGAAADRDWPAALVVLGLTLVTALAALSCVYAGLAPRMDTDSHG